MVNPKHFWYIASPYSSKDPNKRKAFAIREKRFAHAKAFTAWTIREGMITYSPIVHSHEIARTFNLPTEHEYWLKADDAMVIGGGGVIVLCIEGWQESVGVTHEVALAHSYGFPVLFAVPDDKEGYVLRSEPPK